MAPAPVDRLGRRDLYSQRAADRKISPVVDRLSQQVIRKLVEKLIQPHLHFKAGQIETQADVHPETESEMDARLGDSREGWLARADAATVA